MIVRRCAQWGGSVLALAMAAQPSLARAQEQDSATAPEPVPVLSPEAMPPQPEPAGPVQAEVVDFATSYPEGDRLVFTPAYFTRFSPRSALDMVKQLPGFTIEAGRGGTTRGLGQASGNVLQNGERLVSKSETVEDQLARIPAANVIRIELVEGSTLNIPGLSGRVANIVARSSGGVQGQFEWRPQLAAEFSNNRWLEGIASLSGTYGRLSFTTSVEGRPFRGGTGGANRLVFGDGRVEDRFSVSVSDGDDSRYSGSLKYQAPGGLVANLGSSLLLRRFKTREDETTLGPGSLPPAIERIRSRNHGHDIEINGDVEFGLGPGRLKVIGLNTYAEMDFGTQAVIDPADGAAPFGTRFEQYSEKGERIARAEYSWNLWGADWQLSSEAAFNRLDQVGSLFRLASTGQFVPLPFDAGTGGVTEDRYETLLSYGRPITPRLSMQLILGGEQSTITQTGRDALSRTFRRPKGSLSLAWKPHAGLDVTVKFERRVGQLNFADFLATVDLAEDNENDSNNQLRPDQSFGGEIEVTRDFGAWGSLKLRAFRRVFADFVTIIPKPGGGEARGNIDRARIMGAEFTGTLRFDRLGLTGAKLDVAAQFRDSVYIDPVEGIRVPVQFAQPRNIELNYRHDLPRSSLAWGWSYRNSRFNPYYRVAEFGLDHNPKQFLQVFVEHKDVLGLTVQARLGNMLEGETVLDRSVFTGPRGTSPLAFTEYRVREIGKVVSFVVKGAF